MQSGDFDTSEGGSVGKLSEMKAGVGVVTLGSWTSEGMALAGSEVGSNIFFENVGYLVGL